MTPEEKRDRRKARHELQREAKRQITRRIGLFATTRQLHAAARRLTDIAIKQELGRV